MGIMKSHNLLSESWRNKEASDVIPSDCEDLRTRAWIYEAGGGRCPCSSKENKFTLPPSFCLFRPWVGGCPLTLVRTCSLLYEAHCLTCTISSRNTLTDTWTNVVPAIGLSLSPVTSINHHKDLYRGNQSKVQWAVTHCDCHPCKRGNLTQRQGGR